MRVLNEAGYYVVVVTNQAGVARGLCSTDDVERLHDWMNSELRTAGAHIDAFYYCPHHPSVGTGPQTRACDCRKPSPGMLQAAMTDWPIDSATSFLIGDNETDLIAARRAGVRGYLYATGSVAELVQRVLTEITGAADKF